MYDRVKQWVFEEGGRLVYLGGNGLNCEVELLANGSMVCHNGTISGLTTTAMGGHESRMRDAPRVGSEPARRACSRPPAR